MRTCTKCGEGKPTSEFRLRDNGRRRRECKSCLNEHSRLWREQNREKSRATSRAWREENPGRVAANNRAYREKHLEEISANGRAWREENPERVDAYQRAYREINREARKATARARHAEDPEKRRATNSRWRKANPEAYQLSKHTARGKRRGARLGPGAGEYAQIVLRDPCSYCPGVAEQLDHIEPVARGGDSEWTNLTGACEFCNKRKNARPVLLFLHESRGLERAMAS